MRCGEGKGCSGEMWSPLADRPPRSVAPSSTSGSHQSDRLGGICTPTSGISRLDSRTSSRISSSDTSLPHAGIAAASPAVPSRWAESAISAGSAP